MEQNELNEALQNIKGLEKWVLGLKPTIENIVKNSFDGSKESAELINKSLQDAKTIEIVEMRINKIINDFNREQKA